MDRRGSRSASRSEVDEVSARERNKGARGEREVVQLLRDHGYSHAERSSNGRAQQNRGDISNGPPACTIEVKYQERLNVPAALRQVEADCPPHNLPILLHRSSRQPWLATLPADELLALLRLRDS